LTNEFHCTCHWFDALFSFCELERSEKNTISAPAERQLFSIPDKEEGPEGVKPVVICKLFSPGKWDLFSQEITQKHS